MAEIRFYHLTARTLEQTLPVLLERTLQRGWRAVVCVGSEERVETLAGHLWTWSKEGFLPHGTKRDGFAEEQPVWITDQVENPNRAQVLFLGDGADSDGGGGFETVCDLFDGNDPDAVQAARGRWKSRREAGHALVYYQQDEAGAWSEKQRVAAG
ncbi:MULTISPECIES: DNA polymerase III subunit chi [Inquilinus]|jgi:DNA polymerase-3 subunit chi|uniref:DNA polymerase-3 subunit chi n=1 Tax=Inquilinus ginsengisoli TaxID=363840 RepID=A0ABU1JW29_9PROT|nr:DNA polymerase III subunit chi [Inquilinus ginsengisoli]MDR6292825.1 DNA polymerase-3 subunit chi [Inquilinus ginsengisoli]